jgi:hypothetical protein
MAERRFDHLRDARAILPGEVWQTKEVAIYPASEAQPIPIGQRFVVILSPDDVSSDPDSFDIRVSPLSTQVEQASELDLKLDMDADVVFDRPADRGALARYQILELWNDQSMLKINLDHRLGRCTDAIQSRIKQVLRWCYGLEAHPGDVVWVGSFIEGAEDPRLRFQEQELEATRGLQAPVEQLFQLMEDEESEEAAADIIIDDAELAEYTAAVEAWQEESLQAHQEENERLRRFLRENFDPIAFKEFIGPCPETSRFVMYQEGDLSVEDTVEIQQHVLFCRSCLEALVALGRADEVDDDPTQDDIARAELPPALGQVLFEHVPVEAMMDLIADRLDLDAAATKTYLQHLKVCQRCLQEVMTLRRTARLVMSVAVYLAVQSLRGFRARTEQHHQWAAAGRQELEGVVVAPDGTERPVRVPVDESNPPRLDQQGVFTVTLWEPTDEDFADCAVQVLLQGEVLAEGHFTRRQCQIRTPLPPELLRYVHLLTGPDVFPVELPPDDLSCRIRQQR